jgi:predicted DCC family thiol-disulfide oxidoreductase YuxK
VSGVLIYDGDCGICTDSAKWTRKHLVDRDSVQITPFQRIDYAAFGLTLDDVSNAAWWIDPDGTTHRGHRAVARALEHCAGRWWLLAKLLKTWPLSIGAAALYRWVAENRQRLSRGDAVCEPIRSESRPG